MSSKDGGVNLDMTVDSLQGSAVRAAQIYTQIYCELEQRRVDPGVSHEQLQALFAGSIGELGIGVDAALEEFVENVLPHSMGTAHPLYMGLVNSSPLPAGPLADLLVSSLNNNGGAFHQSPAITVTEEEVVREFAKLCGLDGDVVGMLLPGGTFANLQALVLARQFHFPQWSQDGPLSLGGQPRVYRSAATHFCMDRAATVVGLGRKGLVEVPAEGRGEMDVAALETMIIKDRNEGSLPFMAVANAGTTATGAMDDIQAIANVCERHNMWLHVDACYGGGALLARPRLTEFLGMERADSISVDPHKWFFIPMTAGLLLTPHRELELQTFDVQATYIPGETTVNPFRRGIPTSRRSAGLTVWLTLRAHGWGVIREAVERNIALTRRLERLLQASGFRVLPDGKLSVCCARWEPAGFSPLACDELQGRIAAEVIRSGRAWFNTTKHDGDTWLRLNLLNIHTRERHIDELAELVTETAQCCAANASQIE